MTGANNRRHGNGSIRERNGVHGVAYQARFTIPDDVPCEPGAGRHITKTFPTREEAEAWLSRNVAAVEAARHGVAVEPMMTAAAVRERDARDGVTVGEYAAWFLEHHRKRGGGALSPGTLNSYRSRLGNYVLPRLGGVPMRSVTSGQLAGVLDAMPVNDGTGDGKDARWNVDTLLRTMFHRAAHDPWEGGAPLLDADPMEGVPRRGRRSRPRDTRAFDVPPARMWELCRACPAPFAPFVMLCRGYGLRCGEALGLQRRDVEDRDGCVFLHVSRQWQPDDGTGKPGYTPLKTGESERVLQIRSRRALDMVRRHLAVYVGDAPESPLFPSARDPRRPMGNQQARLAWGRVRDRFPEYAGRDDRRGGNAPMKLHALRHCAETDAARFADGNVVMEAEFMGHAPDYSRMTFVYQEATPATRRRFYERLGAWLDTGRDPALASAPGGVPGLPAPGEGTPGTPGVESLQTLGSVGTPTGTPTGTPGTPDSAGNLARALGGLPPASAAAVLVALPPDDVRRVLACLDGMAAARIVAAGGDALAAIVGGGE